MTYYPSNLTDSHWQVIKRFLKEKRKRKYSLRLIFDAMLYVAKSGCQWRMLPDSFPPWQLVYYYFSRWNRSGLLGKIRCSIVEECRLEMGKSSQPSVGIMDSQSVKSTLVSSKTYTGYDGGKKIKGVKRHLIVDTNGLLLGVVTHSAGMSERAGGKLLLGSWGARWSKIVKVFVDGGYRLPGKNQQEDSPICGYQIQIVKRSDVSNGQISTKRWIVERTIAWIETFRRNCKSFERLPITANAMVELTLIRIMVNKLKI